MVDDKQLADLLTRRMNAARKAKEESGESKEETTESNEMSGDVTPEMKDILDRMIGNLEWNQEHPDEQDDRESRAIEKVMNEGKDVPPQRPEESDDDAAPES